MKQKDELIDALRERLSDLEAPVDPGLWAGIQARMAEAAVASGTDPVTELFRDGLKDAEAPVDPGVWSSISSQLSHPAVAGTVSVGAWVGGGIAAAVVVGGLWWGMSANDAPAVVAEKQPVAAEQAVVQPSVEVVVGTPDQEEEHAVPPIDPSSKGTDAEAPGKEKATSGLPAELSNITAATTFTIISPETSGSDRSAEDEPAVRPAEGRTHEIGPNFSTVQEIMARAEKEVDENPAPAITPDPQVHGQPEATKEPEPDQSSEPALRTEEASLFIPNVFTPNNDGVNDRLEVSATGVSEIRVSIYSASSDRLMYRSNDLTPWDGRDPSGVLCPEGYYFYAIEATGPDGKTITKGTVVRLNTH
ncbi:MAG: gliding motility-associated C-terminal domain-containing protein [Flavobacteriales bacterium]|nr:MAG: gliding motility-associated C-terminal domain-containing protein [Flavobacteriales bacterium]